MSKKGAKKNINNLQDEIKDLQNKLARVLADYDNYQKRTEKEQEGFYKYSSVMIVTRLLPVWDMLNTAQEHLADPGLAIALKEFKQVLNDEGYQQLTANIGDDFNEEIHEAVEALEAEDENLRGKVALMVLSGWRLHEDKIIRPVKVKVYNK